MLILYIIIIRKIFRDLLLKKLRTQSIILNPGNYIYFKKMGILKKYQNINLV